ncbi:MAG: response regulator [Flavobacterium sp.]|nr:response regulator [Flavobacterium sp.]
MKLLFTYILLFLISSFQSVAQINNPTKKEIFDLIKTADIALLNLDFEKSLKIAKKALEYSYKINDNTCIANAYNELAGNYEQLSENDRALEYYIYALSYAKKANNLTVQDYIYNNSANIYFFVKKQYQLGIENYNRAIECSTKNKDFKQIAFTKSNLAWAYFTINDTKNGFECLDYINKNKVYFEDSYSKSNLEMLNAMGYGAKGDEKNANIFFLKSIATAKQSYSELDLLSIYEEYADYLFKIKNYEKAFFYHKTLDGLKDKTYNNKLIINAQLISKKIDLEIYKNEFKRSELENKAQKIIISKTKIINVLFGILLFFLGCFLVFIFKNNKVKLQNNNLLVSKNRELEIANIKAVESSNLKSQFVSTISHELRTPLYGVIGITNMLIDEHKELVGSEHLKSLKFSANYLLSLVNDILHINKIEENKIILDKQIFDINEELLLIKNSLIFLSKNNNNEVKINIDESIPKLILGDKMRLNQILINLISNALKFTKNGLVKVHITLEKLENNTCYLNFTIADNGVGIAKENQDKIFEKFVQVGQKNEDYQGTGLGLSIVQKLINLFESEIFIESELAVGTTFSFTLPFEIENYIQKDISIITNEFSTNTLKILVVDDNRINQIVTKKIIEKNNLVCVIADNGFTAIELLRKERFDMILMDINMPDITGYETTRIIRNSGNKIPIIALTAYSKDEVSNKVFESGMNDILIKPFQTNDLLLIIVNNTENKNAD